MRNSPKQNGLRERRTALSHIVWGECSTLRLEKAPLNRAGFLRYWNAYDHRDTCSARFDVHFAAELTYALLHTLDSDA